MISSALLGRQARRRVAQTVPYDPLMPEAGTPYCLFDINGKRRGIWLSVLFAVRDEADWERVRASLAGCRQIAVIDDCVPGSKARRCSSFTSIACARCCACCDAKSRGRTSLS